MQGFNLGPEWFWQLLLVLAGIGLLSAIAGIIYIIYWLLTHIRIDYV